MVLSEIDRNLLERCLARKPRSWEDFVDRFLGLVVHVINHTAQSRSIRLSAEDREDLAADVFLTVVADDFSILRRFRGDSSLATYLTVIARRVVVRELLRRKSAAPLAAGSDQIGEAAGSNGAHTEQRIADREEVERLMRQLEQAEADVVRMYHLEGLSYREISQRSGIAENTIGPTLSRAREKMRIREKDVGLKA
ncbi:MAG: sigma-70 family RNA polymerase sigma factor [Planctomycetales bacterium]|nr:sigma-70 family RNA polymerase sigma factor [Planctomycetales bacterium]